MSAPVTKKPVTYILLKSVLTAIAMLPLTVLYVGADIMYFLMYHVVRYRVKLVRKNLRTCMPQMSHAELRKIERQFYHNFADYIIEALKLLHISDKEIMRRFRFENLKAITDSMAAGRSVVAYFSHCMGWEWAPSITLHCRAEMEAGDAFCQIYRPLRNRTFDMLMLQIRSRFGSESIPKAHALRRFLEMRRKGTVSVTGFMSDQKPSHGDTLHVVNFMGRPTAVITGTELLARRLSMTAVYWDLRKTARGHYVIKVIPMAENAAETEPYALTDSYFKLLEKTIRRDPAIWLWSHNRWKNPIPENALQNVNPAK